jgi:hypothetical protein
MDSCSPCSGVNISVESDGFIPIDTFSVGGSEDFVSRVYEIPSTRLTVTFGSFSPGARNNVRIVILGRSTEHAEAPSNCFVKYSSNPSAKIFLNLLIWVVTFALSFSYKESAAVVLDSE